MPPLPYSDYREGSASSGPVETIKFGEDKDSLDYLEVCAKELHECIKANDIKGIASALRSAFEILESQSQKDKE